MTASRKREFRKKLLGADVHALQLRQLLLGLVPFLQPGVDNRVAVLDFSGVEGASPSLRGLVHRQQLAQFGERLFAGFVVDADSTSSNRSLIRLC